jgi:hypothetical protein
MKRALQAINKTKLGDYVPGLALAGVLLLAMLCGILLVTGISFRHSSEVTFETKAPKQRQEVRPSYRDAEFERLRDEKWNAERRAAREESARLEAEDKVLVLERQLARVIAAGQASESKAQSVERKLREQLADAQRSRRAAEDEANDVRVEMRRKSDELGRLAVENAQLKDQAARAMMLQNDRP